MQISYKTCLDDWVAFQVFHYEQLKPLTKHDTKTHLKIIIFVTIFLVTINALSSLSNEAESFSWGLPIFLIIILSIVMLWQRKRVRNVIYQRSKIAFAPEFERCGDLNVTWDVTPECIIIRDPRKETKYLWDNIRRITVCPEYLFIYFGLADYAMLPKRALAGSDYPAYSGHLVRLYQEHAAQHGNIANIVQSDWIFNPVKVKEKTTLKWSVKKFLFTGLWGLIFAITGFIMLLLIALVLMVAMAVLQDFITLDEEAFTKVMAAVLILGTMLAGITGIGLALTEKLPGTK